MGPETRNAVVGKAARVGPKASIYVPTQPAAPKMHQKGDAGSHKMPGRVSSSAKVRHNVKCFKLDQQLSA